MASATNKNIALWSQMLQSTETENWIVLLIDPLGRITGEGLPSETTLITSSRLTLDQHHIVDIYRIVKPSPGLLNVIVSANRTKNILVVYTFDWLGQTAVWDTKFRQDTALLPENANYLLVSVRYTEMIDEKSAMALDDDCDTCQQYLRALALSLEAPLLYESPTIDWNMVLAQQVLGTIATQRVPPSVIDGPYAVIWPGNDSKNQIMAINSEFDFDSVSAGKALLPELHDPPKTSFAPVEDENETITLEDILRAHDETFTDNTNAAGEQEIDFREFKFPKENSKKAIGDFLEYLEHKSK